MRHPAAPLLLVALWAASGCQHTAPASAPAGPVPAAAVPAPADDNLNAVLWMQTSAEYQAVTRSLYQAATARLPDALSDPAWDALAPADRMNRDDLATLPPAVILDLDETVLDNSPYQARLVRDGTEFDPAGWAAWVEERSARPVPGVVGFARAASARGVTLFYVSNRDQSMQAATLDNLRAAGLPVANEEVFLGRGLVVADCTQADRGDKSCRRQQVARRYRVLMQFGDQVGDFVEIPAAADSAGTEGDPVAASPWFGERWWMLPNPSYGGWETAPFQQQRQLPRAERRAAKRAALRDN